MQTSHPGADSCAPSTSQQVPPSTRLLCELRIIEACSAGAAALVEFRPEQIDNIGTLDEMIQEGKQ